MYMSRSHVKLDKTLDDPRLKNEIEWVETAFKDILGFWPLLLSPPSNYTDSPDVLAKVAHDYDYTSRIMDKLCYRRPSH